MADQKDLNDPLAIAMFSEIFMVDQLARARLAKALPKGMELSHFTVLNHLARANVDRTPAQLARSFHVTRGAMTNTIGRLEWAGYVHVRPDWDDARRKFVSISDAVEAAGAERVRAALPVLRELRLAFDEPATPAESTSSRS